MTKSGSRRNGGGSGDGNGNRNSDSDGNDDGDCNDNDANANANAKADTNNGALMTATRMTHQGSIMAKDHLVTLAFPLPLTAIAAVFVEDANAPAKKGEREISTIRKPDKVVFVIITE